VFTGGAYPFLQLAENRLAADGAAADEPFALIESDLNPWIAARSRSNQADPRGSVILRQR
jgi:hypothetical protein